MWADRFYASDSRNSRRLRAMYAGGAGNRTARRFARLWATVFGWGLQPKRWVTMEVAGRATRQPRQFPLGMADLRGQWYLVSMLGECAWVRNVRAADGQAVLIRRGRRPVHLVEVPVADRARIIQRYLAQVPGARPHIPVAVDASLADFERVAASTPVFAVHDRVG